MPGFGKKLVLISYTLLRNPAECWERISHFVEFRREGMRKGAHSSYCEIQLTELIQRLERNLQTPIAGFLREEAVMCIQRKVRERLDSLKMRDPPFGLSHTAELDLSLLCYLVCRVVKPEAVVETGVAYGANTAFILAALNENDRGRLFSIDLPPLGEKADEFVGALVPDDLKGRWQLIRGSSRRCLPPLLKSLSSIEVFVHDSLHTYSNMTFEFEMAINHLGRPAAIVADDIEGNTAFHELAAVSRSIITAAIKGKRKNNLIGFCYYRPSP